MAAVIKRISWTAETQHGYVTRAQAISEGATDVDLHRAVASGVLERVGHGVYRVVGAQEHPHQELWVAWLQIEADRAAHERERDPTVWVSHWSAARVLDLGVVAADVHEFSSVDRRQTRRRDVRIHRLRAPLGRHAWDRAAGMPVTRAARTIVDLTRSGADAGHVGSVIVDALEGGLTTRDDLAAVLADRPDPAGLIASMMEQATSKFAPR
ncbi:MAG TPA: type IV toxin-antitoxin system AbiEi family antitoxin domain-containing protein [Nitriliruptorales bacterium]